MYLSATAPRVDSLLRRERGTRVFNGRCKKVARTVGRVSSWHSIFDENRHVMKPPAKNRYLNKIESLVHEKDPNRAVQLFVREKRGPSDSLEQLARNLGVNRVLEQ